MSKHAAASRLSAMKVALGAGVAALAVATAASAMAQDVPAAASTTPVSQSVNNDTIVVTGFNKSVSNALRIRRLSTAIVDSVTAEDVGKLPDVSIADAISRLPGVAVQSSNGRGEFISIRGFSGDFTGALLNGREIATIDDNRRFDYSQMPGDLFNRVDVIKTASADLLGSGLAGTVNLQAIDPLSNKRVFSVNGQGELNSYGKENPDMTNKGYKVTAIFINKFADDTLGVSLGASALQSPVQDRQYDAWGYPTDSSGNYGLGGAKWFATTDVAYRQTGYGHIIYKPDDKFELSLDALYSNYKEREYQRGFEVPLTWGGVPVSNVTSANGFEQSATYFPVYPVVRNNYNTRDAYTEAFAGNFKYHANQRLTFTLDASYSRAHRHDRAIESYSGFGYNKSGTAHEADISRLSSGVYQLSAPLFATDLQDLVLTDPQGWGYYPAANPANGNNPKGGAVVQAGYDNEPLFTDTIKALRGSLTQDLDGGFLKNIEAGVNYQVRTKVNGFTGYYLVPPIGTTSLAVPSSAIVGRVNPAYTTLPSLAYNVPEVMAALTGSFRNETTSETSKQWRVQEKVLTAYAQINFSGPVGGLNLSGNFGGQFVHTNQNSIGNGASATGTYQPTYGGGSYNYFLPSLNFKLALDDTADIHIAASRTLSRSRMLDQNSSYIVAAISPDGTPLFIGGQRVVLQAGGGNPYLRPYFSDNVDIGIEKFFAQNQGIIGLNYFYKRLTNFVDPNNNHQSDFSAFSSLITPELLASLNTTTYTTQGPVFSPANTGNGWADGFELQATVPFSIASKSLDGFGVRGSASRTESSIRFANGTPVTLPGLSEWVVNAQAYFEKYGFNARVSYQYRSNFLGEYLAFGAQLQLTSTLSRKTIDAQIGYDFKNGPLNGLSIYLQGKNLTDAPFVTYANQDPRQVLNYEKYGPTYLAGATFKF